MQPSHTTFLWDSGCNPIERHVVPINPHNGWPLGKCLSFGEVSANVDATAERRDFLVARGGISERSCVEEGVTADDRLEPGPGVETPARLLLFFRPDDSGTVHSLFLPVAIVLIE